MTIRQSQHDGRKLKHMMRRCITSVLVTILTSLSVLISYSTGLTYKTDYSAKYDIRFNTYRLGNYKIEVNAQEIPTQKLLPLSAVSKSYFKTGGKRVDFEVDNLEPSALYQARNVVKADVVFALGKLEQAQELQDYIGQFTKQLESSSNNIDAYVEQVETQTLDLSALDPKVIIDTWTNYPGEHYGSNYQAGWTAGNGTMYTTANVNFTGYYSEDFMDVTDGKYQWYMRAVGTADPQGWCFRISKVGETYSFYALEITEMERRVVLVRIDAWQAGSYATHGGPIYHGMINGQDGTYHGGVGQATSNQGAVGEILAYAPITNPVATYTIENKGNSIKVTSSVDGELISYVDNSPKALKSGAFGPYADSEPGAVFSDIMIEVGGAKTLGEAISDVSWRDGSVRFVIHATDTLPIECDPENLNRESDYQYTITKLLNSNTYLINLGNEFNKDVLNKLVNDITQADGTKKGAYYNNTPIVKGMLDSKDYIVDICKNLSKPVDWILVNTEVLWDTIYRDSELDLPLNFGEHDGMESYNGHRRPQSHDNSDINNLINGNGIDNKIYTDSLTHYYEDIGSAKILAEKWRYRHFNYFFDNSEKQEGYHNIWMDNPVEVFIYPGKYRINYKRKDNPMYTNVDTGFIFDEYRKWSNDYDYKNIIKD